MSVLVAEDLVSTRAPLISPAPGLEPGGWDDATLAFGGRPRGLAVSSDGTVFVSLPASGAILRLETGRATAVSARSIGGLAGGVGKAVPTPAGLAVGPDGTLFVADAVGHRVWAIAPTGDWRVVAGSVSGFRDGPADEALFRYPTDVAIGPDGTCYVADGGNHRIRTISPEGAVKPSPAPTTTTATAGGHTAASVSRWRSTSTSTGRATSPTPGTTPSAA